jgi:tetratricopeptide (TPR) repeat protein
MNEPQKAAEDFDSAIKLDPQNPFVYKERGEIAFLVKRDYETAIKYLTRAIELKKDYALAYNMLGRAHNGKGESVKAIECFGKAIEYQPNNPVFYRNRAATHSALGNEKAAKRDRDQADLLEKQK